MGRPRYDTVPQLQGPGGVVMTNDGEKAALLNAYFAAQSTFASATTESGSRGTSTGYPL